MYLCFAVFAVSRWLPTRSPIYFTRIAMSVLGLLFCTCPKRTLKYMMMMMMITLHVLSVSDYIEIRCRGFPKFFKVAFIDQLG